MRRMIITGLAAAGLLLAGCQPLKTSAAANPSAQSPGAQAAGAKAAGAKAPAQPPGPPGVQAGGVLRLGLTGNLTDAPALVGWQLGYYGQDLGNITLQPQLFPTSTAELSALADGQLDAAYLDPVAALQAWQAGPGGLIKIIAGTASGGAQLIVAGNITSPAQLKGRHLAPPAADTQLAAASHWLRQHSLPAPAAPGTGASTSASILSQFKTGKIAGGWETPPLTIQMTNAGGHALITENTLWPGGSYPTAVLAVTSAYLTAHPAAITALLTAHIQATRLLTTSPVSAAAAIAQRLAANGTPLPLPVITKSLVQLTFTDSPLPGPLQTEAQDAATAGLIKPIKNIASIYDLTPLNQIRKKAGQPPINP